jgi:hypothetical protein
MTEADLLAAGFTKHQPNAILTPYADALYRKDITDGCGTRYFLNCYHYPPLASIGESWAFDCQLTLDDDRNFNMQTVGRYSIEQAESLFTATWKSLNCQHYERNEQ